MSPKSAPQPPALDPESVPEVRGAYYPEPFTSRYLEVGSRHADDQAHYPDDDLLWIGAETRQPDGHKKKKTVAAHKDGTRY
ncbi:MAG: hypothetical protein HYV18_02905 [Gammaproteobacteria bacterium]|nr:hypothetical protein [Gammaproteobacteria bacterium]